MILTRTKLAAACLLGAAAVALMASAPKPDQELRVCADPFDLPFSNDHEEGFENKIAHVERVGADPQLLVGVRRARHEGHGCCTEQAGCREFGPSENHRSPCWSDG